MHISTISVVTLALLVTACGGSTSGNTAQTTAGGGGSSGSGAGASAGKGGASGSSGSSAGAAGNGAGTGGSSAGAAGSSAGKGGSAGSGGIGGSSGAGAGTGGSAGKGAGGGLGGNAGSGSGGKAGGSSTGGAGGSAPFCCTDDMSCGDFAAMECVMGVCKQPAPQGKCWRQADCGVGEICQGESVCGCNVVCGGPDMLGICMSPTTNGCPLVPPTGGACGLPNGSVCEYGSDELVSCREHVICSNGQWSFPPGACPVLDKAGQNGCLADATGAGSDCATNGQICDMGGGQLCECGACFGGPCMTKTTWACSGPPGQGCPALAPDTGQPCATDGLTCNYGVGCSFSSAQRSCVGGVWVDQPLACAN